MRATPVQPSALPAEVVGAFVGVDGRVEMPTDHRLASERVAVLRVEDYLALAAKAAERDAALVVTSKHVADVESAIERATALDRVNALLERNDALAKALGEVRLDLVKVVAHTGHYPDAARDLLVGLLVSCKRNAVSGLAKIDALLARSVPS